MFAIFLFQTGVKMAPSQVSQRAETSTAGQPIGVLLRIEREKYSTGDTVRRDVSLQNSRDATVYKTERLFVGGRIMGSRRKKTGRTLPIASPELESLPLIRERLLLAVPASARYNLKG
jgi:hypothetical protein